ncbi:MAG: DUF268 domain-containing protein [Bacteroidota bacterium]
MIFQSKIKEIKSRRLQRQRQAQKVAAFNQQYRRLQEQEKSTQQRFKLIDRDLKPMLNDNTTKTSFDRHYIYHTAWAARALKKTTPELHVDISSTLYFCSIVSAFVPVDFYDYRPAELKLSNLTSKKADLTNLHFADSSVSSISCMHTVEHVGLGRYGDPLDYDGDIKAINELSRVLAKGGNLLFVVPVGREAKIIFNAHRIYTKDLVTELFASLELQEFALIPEKASDGGLVDNPSSELLNHQNYACGCFRFTKK